MNFSLLGLLQPVSLFSAATQYVPGFSRLALVISLPPVSESYQTATPPLVTSGRARKFKSSLIASPLHIPTLERPRVTVGIGLTVTGYAVAVNVFSQPSFTTFKLTLNDSVSFKAGVVYVLSFIIPPSGLHEYDLIVPIRSDIFAVKVVVSPAQIELSPKIETLTLGVLSV